MKATQGKYLIGLLVLGAVATGCSIKTTTDSDDDSQEDKIFVQGSATVVSAPDIAKAQLSVQTFADSAAVAVAENNAKSAAIVAALKEKGVAAKDLQTSGFYISPQVNYKEGEPPKVIGYWVNNGLLVTMRDLTRVGEILQVGIDAGSNSISGLFFGLDNPETIQQDARVRAVENARQRAESLIGAAGGKLGRVLSIRETGASLPPIIRGADFAGKAGDAPVPVQPGELSVTCQVEVVFEIQ